MLFPLYGRRKGVRLALGLHPLDAARVDLTRELRLFDAYAGHTSYIGEIGLDFSREGSPSRDVQEKAFKAVLNTAGVASKMLSVHSRGAPSETIERLAQAGAQRVVLHWFSGSLRDVETALAAGFFFSVNPPMTRSVRGSGIVDALPPDRVLAETDGPYARVGGRTLEPPDVALVLRDLAARWRMTLDEVTARLANNLLRLCDGLASDEVISP